MSELYSGRVWCAWCHDNVSLVDGHGKSLRIEQYYEIDVILSMKHLDIYIMNRANNIQSILLTHLTGHHSWSHLVEGLSV